jgi:hypothetical protein
VFQSLGVACALLQQLQALSIHLANPEDSTHAEQQQAGTCSSSQGGSSNSKGDSSSNEAQQAAQQQRHDNLAAALQLLAALLDQGCQAVSSSASAQQLDQLSFAVQVAESALRLLAHGSTIAAQQHGDEHTAAVGTPDVHSVRDQQQRPHASGGNADRLAADKSQLAAATAACTRITTAAVAIALQHINAPQQQQLAAAAGVARATSTAATAAAAISQQGQQVPGLGLQQGQQLLQAVLSLVLTVTKMQRLTVPAIKGSHLGGGRGQHAGSSQGSKPDLCALLLQPADASVCDAGCPTFLGPFGACGGLLMAHAGYMLGYMSLLVQHYRALESPGNQVAAVHADAHAAAHDTTAAAAAATRLLGSPVAAPLPIECTPAAFFWLGRCFLAIARELQAYALHNRGEVQRIVALVQDLTGLNTGLCVMLTQPADTSAQGTVHVTCSPGSASSKPQEQFVPGAGGSSGCPRILGFLEDSYGAGRRAAQLSCTAAATSAGVKPTTTSSSSSSAAPGAVSQLAGSGFPAESKPDTAAAGGGSGAATGSSSSSNPGLFSVLQRVAGQGPGTKLFEAASNARQALDKSSSKLQEWHSTQQALKVQRLELHKQLLEFQSRQLTGRPGSKVFETQQQAIDKLQTELHKLDAAMDESAAQRHVGYVGALVNLSLSLIDCGSTLARDTLAMCCGNGNCDNLGTVSESFALVRGRACVCGGCLKYGVDPALAKR